ncbi:unnamed protein product [Withania somnifera]
MGKAYAAGLFAALASATETAYADSSSPFSSSTTNKAPSAPAVVPQTAAENPKVRNDNPRTTSAGFDPEALERGAKALREINSSKSAKQVFDVIKKQEETRQGELSAKMQEFKALQAQAETERQRVIYDEQKKLAQQQAQIKSQMARYEDELARKRMQACRLVSWLNWYCIS